MHLSNGIKLMAMIRPWREKGGGERSWNLTRTKLGERCGDLEEISTFLYHLPLSLSRNQVFTNGSFVNMGEERWIRLPIAAARPGPR